MGALMAKITDACLLHGSCSVMLTGGRTAARLYRAMASSKEFSQIRQVNFYFGDERCVPPDHPDSNFDMAMRTLFKHGVPVSCNVIRMLGELPDNDAAAKAYEANLPPKIDVLLLSVGEDGHIASLFPNAPALNERNRLVVAVRDTTKTYTRLSITPKLIKNSRSVFVMAIGKKKREVYETALRDPHDIASLPARLVLNRNWIMENSFCLVQTLRANSKMEMSA